MGSWFTVEKARLLSRFAHEGQYDKNGDPYWMHPAAVASLVETVTGEDLPTEWQRIAIIVAYLHDVIEDTDISAKMLLDLGVPAEAVDGVVVMSEFVASDRSVRKSKDDYFRDILASPITTAVKRADVMHNSNEDRLARLDEKTAARLRKKYADYKQRLSMAITPRCIVDEPNHSDDVLEVYHGYSTPTAICGYHEQKIGAGKAREAHNRKLSEG